MSKIKPGKNGTKRDVIIQKASVLFKEKGYSASSMRELADAVGVEAPSLYNHIGSKAEILQSICFQIAGEFTGQMDLAMRSSAGKLAILEDIVRFHIRMMLEKFDEVFVTNHEWKSLKEPDFSNFLQQRRNYEKKLVTLVEEGIRTGEIRNADPHVVVLTILSAVRGLEFWNHHKKNIDPQILEDEMVNNLLNGIIK